MKKMFLLILSAILMLSSVPSVFADAKNVDKIEELIHETIKQLNMGVNEQLLNDLENFSDLMNILGDNFDYEEDFISFGSKISDSIEYDSIEFEGEDFYCIFQYNGENITYGYYEKYSDDEIVNAELYINGNGEMDINDISFVDEYSLSSVVICEGVTSISDNMFLGCENLRSVMFPNSVKTIDDSAFAECTSLESVILGNGIETIGDSAFSGCENLENLTIPESVTSIGDHAFEQCTSLKSLAIPGSVKSIGTSAFYECTSLKNVTLGNGIKSIGKYAFHTCAIEEIIIPDSVISICNNAFYCCDNLTSVKIGNGVTLLEEGVFFGCNQLRNLTIGLGVTTVREGFLGCDSLHEIVFPASVQTIEIKEFNKSIREISIPSSVTSISNAEAYASTEIIVNISKSNIDYNTLKALSEDPNVKNLVVERSQGGEFGFYADVRYDYVSTKNIVIKCEPGSYAEGFAKENNIEYSSTVSGDAECFTNTAYKKLSSSYKFYVETREAIEDATVIAALYSADGSIISTESAECDGDTQYTISLPISDKAKYVKIFVWRSFKDLAPLGEAEIIELE